jgi:hypothetical protein
MEQYIGLDVSLKSTHLCVVDRNSGDTIHIRTPGLAASEVTRRAARRSAVATNCDRIAKTRNTHSAKRARRRLRDEQDGRSS